MARINEHEAGGPQIIAFLDMIADSEIGPEMLAKSDDGYNVLVGSTPDNMLTFPSYADHPNIYNKECNSTAAGRYQFLHGFWPYYKRILGLPDFGPVSQDKWGIRYLRETHAYDVIRTGNLKHAVELASSRWASFPGADYGQHENKFDQLAAAFEKAGGWIA